MSSCEEVLRSLVTSIDDVLAGRGSEAVMSHLAGCASCRRVVEEQREVRVVLSAMPDIAMPPDARARLAARLDAEPQGPREPEKEKSEEPEEEGPSAKAARSNIKT